MESSKRGLTVIIRSPTIAWAVAASASFLAIAILFACLREVRAPTDPAERTASRLSALDAHLKQKICAHRNNNVPKYRSAKDLFLCAEIDVVLEPPTGGPVAVYHPPHENNHGLTLEFLLSNEGLPPGKLWLDVKDLSAGNWATLLSMLSTLIPEDRRSDTIVETSWADPSVRDAVIAFRSKGFLVSYYLPTGDAIRCGADKSQLCETLRADVVRTLGAGFSHLSFDARAYDFVRTLRSRIPADVRLLTWDLSKSWPRADLIREVDTYLVTFPSRHST